MKFFLSCGINPHSKGHYMLGHAIHSIYRATEGEGIFLGSPQIFVRYQGCAIGCLNCDSKETWDFTDGTKSLENVLSEIEMIANNGPVPIKRISITGGDPLHPKHEKNVLELVLSLKERGYFINIEAAGSRVVDNIFDLVDFISFDFKTPSTGVKTNPILLAKLKEQFNGKFQIKSVVQDKKDFEMAYDALVALKATGKTNNDFVWCLTPSYMPGESFPRERFLMAMQMNEDFGGPFRVVGQQHKWLFGPDKRNV